MLFNSIEFIFFASVVFFVTLKLHHIHSSAPKYFLIAVSLVFYSLWKLSDLPILLLSLVGNFILVLLFCSASAGTRKIYLWLSITANLALLLWFKLGLAQNPVIANLLGITPSTETSSLPLGISFFTFQLIAYHVAIARGASPLKFSDYAFVICFFPHLVAGPLVQHRFMLQQITRSSAFRFRASSVFAGISLFIIGLSKKVLIADPLASYSNLIFNAADAGIAPGLSTAWIGSIAGVLNFYFDFSGYSDMASGLALIVGIRLPMNFFSPLKAVSLDEFWKRWNISVTQFIRDHVFRPLAGKNLRIPRHLVAILVTMMIAGMWHGDSWNFFIWGALHGLLLAIQHAKLLVWRKPATRNLSQARKLLGWAQTQFFIISLGCLFQTHTLSGAVAVLKGLFGLNIATKPIELPPLFDQSLVAIPEILWGLQTPINLLNYISANAVVVMIIFAWGLCLFTPNSVQLLGRYRPVFDSTNLLRKGHTPKLSGINVFGWQMAAPGLPWVLIMGALFALSLLRIMFHEPSVFNYYHF